MVQAAIGGQEVSRVYEGEMNFALTVRLAPEFRRNVDAIRAIPVALPNTDPKLADRPISRSAISARCSSSRGAAYIYRENSQRFIPLKYSVRERDLGSTVAEAQERIGKTVPVPQGYSMEWSGEFGALVEAKKRLALIVPLSLLLILMLLYSLFNSVRDSLLALSGIPFAVAGGILGLVRCRPEFQRVGGGRIHLAVRRLGDGWHSARLLHPQGTRRGPSAPKTRSSAPARPGCGRSS